MTYHLSDYQYDLPPELIAQRPAPRRDESRLLVAHADGRFEHRRFRDLADYLSAADIVVVNNTRVIPARLLGRRQSGGAVELLLLQRIVNDDGQAADRWIALARPSARLKEGERITIGEAGEAVLLRRLDGGQWEAHCSDAVLRRAGQAPLPPYIRRSAAGARQPDDDLHRYQTVYARHDGSAAAPTAGLHFTPDLIERLTGAGIAWAEVTLHVGLGTFRPIQTDDIRQHRMHSERYSLSAETASAINAARDSGRRILACGTTTMRALETVADDAGRMPEHGAEGETEIFIYPPYRFRAARSMITNFHLPGSSLMAMVAALVGQERLMSLYRQAIRERYRFYSYGDAMLILE